MIKSTAVSWLKRLMPFAQKKVRIKIQRNNKTISISPEEFEGFAFETDDQLSIEPSWKEKILVRTPDGHLHFKGKNGSPFRIPSKMILSPFKEFFIPEHLCILTGAGSHTLEFFAEKHIQNYEKYMGLWPNMTFLEIGCGIGRDAFKLMSLISKEGKYIGIDVTYDSIAWLRKNVSNQHPNFTFHHFDAKHELYNPLGAKSCLDFALPAKNSSVDRIALGSVFTHLFEEEIIHYMKEIRRVLKPQGLAYATFFLYEKTAVEASRKKSMTPFNLRFEHSIGQGCYVNDPIYKTGAVAFTQESIQAMVEKSGLKICKPIIRGAWSGLFPDSDDGQDVFILGVK